MLRQKSVFSLLVISLIGLSVFPMSNCNAAAKTSATEVQDFSNGTDVSKPDSISSEQSPNSTEVLTERQRDTLDYANKGFKFFKKGQFDQAIFNFNKAIELDPGVTLCYFARG
jgi:tetratricopeptide (TPR) repeat protein